MRKLRNVLALIMAVMMVFTVIPFSAFAQGTAGNYGFSDFPTGWSYDAMVEAVENGLITGYGDSTVRPTDLLTRAQMAAIINRAFGAETKSPIEGKFSDVSADDWFYEDIAKAVKMQTFTGDDTGAMRPNEPITRQDAVLVIARALVINYDKTGSLAKFTDGAGIAGYAAGAVAAFVNRGYINGYTDGSFRPHGNITREEFAQIMDNIFAKYVRTDGTFALGECLGEVILTGNTITLTDTHVAGDLIIGDGAGDTSVTIKNVQVDGRIVFRGGADKVTFDNTIRGDLLVVNDVNNDVHGPVEFQHFSSESFFTDAVYNTPVTFLNKRITTPSASGKGLDDHDTLRLGTRDAETGKKKEEKPTTPGTTVPGGGSPTVYHYDDITFTVSDGATFADNTTAPKTVTIKRGTSLGTDYDNYIPKKANNKFGGWFIDSNANGVYDSADTQLVDSTTTFSTDVSLVAKWDEWNKVTFETKTGTFDSYINENGEIVSVPATTEHPEKEHHTFGGWYYDADNNGKYDPATDTLVAPDATAGVVIDALKTPAGATTALKTHWIPVEYTVTFMNEGTKYKEINATYGVEFGTDKYNSIGTPAHGIYAPAEFLGWCYEEGGVIKTFDATTVIGGNMTVTAVWPGPFDVIFLNADGTETGTKLTVDDRGDKITLPTAAATGITYDNTKYRFVWVYGGTEYKEGDEFTVPGTAKLTAKLIKQITVTFMVDGAVYGTPTVVDEGTTVTAPTVDQTTRTLAGWFDTATDTEFDFATPVAKDYTLEARFTVDIKFVLEEGSTTEAAATQTIAYNTAATVPADPTYGTKKFVGWFFDNSGIETAFDATVVFTAHTTVYAKWGNTVTFMVDGAVYGTPTVVDDGATVTAPTVDQTTRTLVGWFDTATDSEFDFATAIYKDYTLEARFTVNIKFVLEEGSSTQAAASQIINYGTTATVPADPTNGTKKFAGWFYRDDAALEQAFDATVVFTAHTTVYAKWGNTVTFMVDGAVYGTPTVVDDGATVTAPTVDQTTRTLVGWFDTATDSEFDFATAITKDYTLEARFTVNIKFVLEEGSTTEAAATQTIAYNTTATVPADPTNGTKKFAGWFFDNSGIETAFDATVVFTAHTTVYAKWGNTVTFMVDGAVYGTPTVVDDGATVTAPTVDQTTRTLVGWFDTATDTEFDFATAITKDYTLEARFTVNIKFVLEEGSSTQAAASQIINYGTTATVPADPTNGTKKFAGWFYRDDAALEQAFDATVVFTAHTTVYAKWGNTVTFMVDGAVYGTPTVVDDGATVTAPTVDQTTRTLVGWFDTATDTEFDFATAIYKDYTLEARFTVNIKFVLEEGSTTEAAATQTIAYNTTATVPADPTNGTKKFAGWFYRDDAALEQAFDATVVFTAHTTVYAKWGNTVTFMVDGAVYGTPTVVDDGATVTAPTVDQTTRTLVGWFDTATDSEFDFATAIYKDYTLEARFTVDIKFVLEEGSATEAAATQTIAYNTTATVPADPTNGTMVFGGWFYRDAEDAEHEFNATVKFTAHTTVYAKWNYTVVFIEASNPSYEIHTVNVLSNEKVDPKEFAIDYNTTGGTAYQAVIEKFKLGYLANDTTIVSGYESLPKGAVQDEIAGNWYYLTDDYVLEVFDENVEVNKNMEVYYGFKGIEMRVTLESVLPSAGYMTFGGMFYDDERRAAQTALDALYANKDNASLDIVQKQLDDKLPKIKASANVSGMHIDYAPIKTAVSGSETEYQIMNAVIDYKLIDLLGESTVREFTHDAVEDLIKSDNALVISAIDTVLATFATDNDALAHFDAYVMAPGHEDYKAELRKELEVEFKKQYKNLTGVDPTDQVVKDEVDKIMNDTTKRRDLIREVCNDSVVRLELAGDIDALIISHIGDDSVDHGFVDEVVNVALEVYDPFIEEFIDSLKNKKTFYYNKDRQFIVYALDKKLASTTYEEIKAKLPSVITKVLDEAVMKDIFDETLAAYRAEVAVAINALNSNPDTAEGYVSCFAKVIVNPIDDVVIPTYNNYWPKLVGKASGNALYDANPYIKMIETELVHYDKLISTATAPLDGSSGYKIKSVDDYYDFLYDLAVLTYDAADWFTDPALNGGAVDEAMIDSALELAVERIGGYYDKLIAKVSALNNGKVDEAYNKARSLMSKLIGKDNAEMLDTTTNAAVLKLDPAFTKAVDKALEITGYDITSPISVTVASTHDAVTLVQGSKTTVKSIADIAKDIKMAGFTVSVNGTVITVNGKSYDVADYLAKITAKAGYTFNVSLVDRTAAGQMYYPGENPAYEDGDVIASYELIVTDKDKAAVTVWYYVY